MVHRLALVAVCLTSLALGGEKIAWGKPDNGLVLGFSLEKDKWGYGENAELRVHFKNVARDPVEMVHLRKKSWAGKAMHHFTIQYALKGSNSWKHAGWGDPREWKGRPTQTIKAGQSETVKIPNSQPLGTVLRSDYGKPPYQFYPWPPMPGTYQIRIAHSTKAEANGKQPVGSKIWKGSLKSGELTLTVKPFKFLKPGRNPNVKAETIKRLIDDSAKMWLIGPAGKLADLNDPRADAALLMLIRCGRVPRDVAPALGYRLGDAVNYDLLRSAGVDIEGRLIPGSERALGQIGTKTVIARVRQLLATKGSRGRAEFIYGMAESRTKESLALLIELSLVGDIAAVDSLVKRKDPGASAAKLRLMTTLKSPVSDRAARALAVEGEMKAVRWLRDHWNWDNARAFTYASIRWPKPGKGELTQEAALAAAMKTGIKFRKPTVRYLDKRWYIVSMSGSMRSSGHFAYVILDAKDGRVIRKSYSWVPR